MVRFNPFRQKQDYYYYIAGITPNGKPFFYKTDCKTEAEARTFAFEKLSKLLNMEIFPCKSSDPKRAHSEYRPKAFDTTGDMDFTLSRTSHDPNKVI